MPFNGTPDEFLRFLDTKLEVYLLVNGNTNECRECEKKDTEIAKQDVQILVKEAEIDTLKTENAELMRKLAQYEGEASQQHHHPTGYAPLPSPQHPTGYAPLPPPQHPPGFAQHLPPQQNPPNFQPFGPVAVPPGTVPFRSVPTSSALSNDQAGGFQGLSAFSVEGQIFVPCVGAYPVEFFGHKGALLKLNNVALPLNACLSKCFFYDGEECTPQELAEKMGVQKLTKWKNKTLVFRGDDEREGKKLSTLIKKGELQFTQH